MLVAVVVVVAGSGVVDCAAGQAAMAEQFPVDGSDYSTDSEIARAEAQAEARAASLICLLLRCCSLLLLAACCCLLLVGAGARPGARRKLKKRQFQKERQRMV